jgi:1,4-alpha-glucan branching enzyme
LFALADAVLLNPALDNWDRLRHPMVYEGRGWWQVTVPEIPHLSKVKVQIRTRTGTSLGHHFVCVCMLCSLQHRTATGERIDRLPAWTRYTQQQKGSAVLDALYYAPAEPYVPRNPRPARPRALRIYEAHSTPHRAGAHGA